MNSAEKPLWPYSERNGANAETEVQALLAPPDLLLSESEKAAAYDFADGLFRGYLSDGPKVEGEPRTLEEINSTSIAGASSRFYISYFNIFHGLTDARGLGFEPSDLDALPGQLYKLVLAEKPPKSLQRKEVANHSRDWCKDELASRLKLAPALDAEQPDFDTVTVNFTPDKLLDKFAELQEYRRFYRQVDRSLKQAPVSRLGRAKRVLLEVHQARVNNLAAGLYPALNNLARQINALPDSDQASGWRDKLETIAPVAALALGDDEISRQKFASGFARRLDLVRNGADRYDNQANFSPISQPLGALASDLTNASEVLAPEAELPAETIEQLARINWNASELQTFLTTVLADWNLLSQESTDWQAVDDRSGPAEDEKWQVIITPKLTALNVDGKKRIIEVPEKLDRELIETLSDSAHELTHVLQHEFADELAQQLPLAKVKGRRYITGYEMGAIESERELLACFGRSRPTNITYLRALEAKLAGANQTEVARAFADAKSRPTKASYAAAGKNVLRHYRYGGHDSQALDYAERELISRALAVLPEEQARAVGIAGVSFSLAEAAALHNVGLLELPVEIDKNPAEEVLRIFMERFLTDLGSS